MKKNTIGLVAVIAISLWLMPRLTQAAGAAITLTGVELVGTVNTDRKSVV